MRFTRILVAAPAVLVVLSACSGTGPTAPEPDPARTQGSHSIIVSDGDGTADPITQTTTSEPAPTSTTSGTTEEGTSTEEGRSGYSVGVN